MKTLEVTFVIVFIAAIAGSETGHRSVVKFAVENFCTLTFKDCGSTVGKIISVSFNGTCTSQGYAILKRGQVIVIDYKFQAYRAEAALKSTVHGKVGIAPWIPFPMGNPDACENSGLVCPIQANVTLDYKPVLNVLTSYPEVNVLVKWELQSKDGSDVFCVVLPAQITD